MAHQWGGEIAPVHTDCKKESGPREFTIEKSSWGFKSGDKFEIIVSHRDQITMLPDCLENIASSELVSHEVVAHKSLPYLGIQAHPEASWNFSKTVLCNPLSHEEHLKAQSSGDRFIDSFLSQIS